jgi:MoxR-like ATPase
MEQTNTPLDIGALNEKIEKESAFIDILSMEMIVRRRTYIT